MQFNSILYADLLRLRIHAGSTTVNGSQSAKILGFPVRISGFLINLGVDLIFFTGFFIFFSVNFKNILSRTNNILLKDCIQNVTLCNTI